MIGWYIIGAILALIGLFFLSMPGICERYPDELCKSFRQTEPDKSDWTDEQIMQEARKTYFKMRATGVLIILVGAFAFCIATGVIHF